MKNKISAVDLAIIIVVAVLTTVFSLMFIKNEKGLYVEIVSPKEKYIYPLSENREICIKGLLGTTKIEILNGEVIFVDSPCPNNNCVTEGAISKVGQFNACLPNGVSATIIGKTEIDAVSI